MDTLTAQQIKKMINTHTVDCSSDVGWECYVKQNPGMLGFDHLRFRGKAILPTPRYGCEFGCSEDPRRPRIVVTGPLCSGKTVLAMALGSTPEGLLPAIRPKEMDTPEGLLGLADKIAHRDSPVVEWSVWDVFGPLTHRVMAMGFTLSDSFKMKAIWHITAATREARHYFVHLTGEPAQCPEPIRFARHLPRLFDNHYHVQECLYTAPAKQSAAEIVAELARPKYDWMLRPSRR